jgi:hypothetical protein
MTADPPLTVSITTGAQGEPTGYDSAVMKVPARWYVTLAADGRPVFLPQIAMRDLQQLSERFATPSGRSPVIPARCGRSG